jgi:hypothetical protein
MEADWVRNGGVPSASRWAAGAMWALALMLPLSLFGSSPPAATPMLMLLAVLALVSELVGRRGSRRLALPIFVVAWWSFGPLAAWLVDVAALGACAIGTRSTRDPGKHALRAFRATVASVAASLIAGPVRTSLANQDIASVAAPLTFATIYLAAEAAIGYLTREENPSIWALPFVLLPVVGVAGVVLVESGVPAATPLLLGPIVALQMLENASARAREHRANLGGNAPKGASLHPSPLRASRRNGGKGCNSVGAWEDPSTRSAAGRPPS